MQLASIRLVTSNVDTLVTFYAMLSGITPSRPSPDFAELRAGNGLVLAISSERMIRQFNAGAAIAGANRSAIIEFNVADVDAVRSRLEGVDIDYAMQPADMPWGNRSMLLRDPDGNVVNIFSRPA
ncbi:VOC family protein [Devosia sp.]|uniref:VOC family protein n=1 Tax=Devosia sp. TaxID=1871048 RepID=UPI003266EC3E